MWESILINAQNIKTETNKAALISMPSKSLYAGMCFWHPLSLIKYKGGKGYFLSLTFNNERAVKLVKYGSGRYNSHKIVSSLEISAAQFRSSLKLVSDSIAESIRQHDAAQIPVLEIPEEVDIDESLRDKD